MVNNFSMSGERTYCQRKSDKLLSFIDKYRGKLSTHIVIKLHKRFEYHESEMQCKNSLLLPAT